jgi:hypothetical protein
MMTQEEREVALNQMKEASKTFYCSAISIGNHPFIEFTGLINEYIMACEMAHAEGIDFSECNTHASRDLPLKPPQVDYINEKLECIFTGRSVVQSEKEIPI